MNDRARFYHERDRRTAEYGIDPSQLDVPIAVVVSDDAAASRPGQMAALALINMLSRIHRSVTLTVPCSPLLAQALVPGDDLADVMVATALAVDPFIRIEAAAHGSAGVPCIGLGCDLPRDLSIYLGADGAVATVAVEPAPISPVDSTVLGAGLAVCLGAADLLHLVVGHRPSRPRRVSTWRFGEGEAAVAGPAVVGPVDVGDVLMVGAGAVGCSLLYWLREIGVTGMWTVVDGDIVKLHNTNRSLGFLAVDAGWPDGEAAHKAERAAALIGGGSDHVWYDEWMANHWADRPDLVLPLANDRGVRHLIGQRGEPILLSATTSPHESAALHRQIPGRDDCIDCRFPDATVPVFECSTGAVETSDGTSTDAALPFLSAAAGLLLLAGLLQLQSGDLPHQEENQWSLWVATENQSWQQSTRQCSAGCVSALPIETAHTIAQTSRWRRLVAPSQS